MRVRALYQALLSASLLLAVLCVGSELVTDRSSAQAKA